MREGGCVPAEEKTGTEVMRQDQQRQDFRVSRNGLPEALSSTSSWGQVAGVLYWMRSPKDPPLP